jgi:carboxyl-terminal processing protease
MYQSKDAHGEITAYNSDAQSVGVPMAVLVDRYTVGAAEYFAAALNENGALVIGDTTAGGGYAQQRVSLSDGSTLVLSTIEYLTPGSGRSLNGSGCRRTSR